MINLGFFIGLVAIAMVIAQPAVRRFALGSIEQSEANHGTLEREGPFIAPPLPALVDEAQAALECRDFMRGISATAATYDKAALNS
jgi:hypothetical protein